MPFSRPVQRTYQVTRLDIIFTIFLLIAFIWAFFYGSRWGDQHYTTMADPATASYINNFVPIGGLILLYEMFHLFVLPGKTRLKYLPWRAWATSFFCRIRKKLKEGALEYKKWILYDRSKKT